MDVNETSAVDARRRAYQSTFAGEPAKTVLLDLAQFCGAMNSSFRHDALEMAFREGRREVYLRIMAHMNLTENDLFDMARRQGETNE